MDAGGNGYLDVLKLPIFSRLLYDSPNGGLVGKCAEAEALLDTSVYLLLTDLGRAVLLFLVVFNEFGFMFERHILT